MDNRRFGFRLLKQAFEDWRRKRLTWQEMKEKYGISKTSFYKYRKRYHKRGDDGLKETPRKEPIMPHALSWDQKIGILDYIFDNPTHGPDRIGREQVPRIAGSTIWEYLKKEDLNTRRKRRIWPTSRVSLY